MQIKLKIYTNSIHTGYIAGGRKWQTDSWILQFNGTQLLKSVYYNILWDFSGLYSKKK